MKKKNNQFPYAVVNKDINEIFLSFFSPEIVLKPSSQRRDTIYLQNLSFQTKKVRFCNEIVCFCGVFLNCIIPIWYSMNLLVCYYLLGSVNWNMWTSRMRKVRLIIIYFGKSKIWLHVIDKVPFNQVTMKIKTKMMIKWDSTFAFNDTFEAT